MLVLCWALQLHYFISAIPSSGRGHRWRIVGIADGGFRRAFCEEFRRLTLFRRDLVVGSRPWFSVVEIRAANIRTLPLKGRGFHVFPRQRCVGDDLF